MKAFNWGENGRTKKSKKAKTGKHYFSKMHFARNQAFRNQKGKRRFIGLSF